MGKRFYCDYCDKSFPYNSINRKKHNEGSYHQMMRNAYYSNYKGDCLYLFYFIYSTIKAIKWLRLISYKYKKEIT